MAACKRILVAVDRSEASRRAVRYVADLVGEHRDFHVALMHLELPPRMLEWGGSEDSAIEDAVSEERAAAYQEMEREAIREGRTYLQSLQRMLAEKHIDVAALIVQFEEPLDCNTITEKILQTGKERGYGTVVVGRHCFSGLKRLFKHHVGEELVRSGHGVTVWVVE